MKASEMKVGMHVAVRCGYARKKPIADGVIHAIEDGRAILFLFEDSLQVAPNRLQEVKEKT